MVIALVATAFFLPATPATGRRTTLADPFRALRHPALAILAVVAVCYNLGFFSLLAAGPFALPQAGIMQIGWIFFGWGVLLAVASVAAAPALQRRLGTLPALTGAMALFAIDLLVMAYAAEHTVVVKLGIIVAGAFLGVVNTLVTEAVMGAAPVERPVASAAYSFVRFTGGAVGPYVALKLAEHEGVAAPFWFGGVAVAAGVAVLLAGTGVISGALHGAPAAHSPAEAEAELVGDAG
jgi:predicted MFS family arabinose efflux permease